MEFGFTLTGLPVRIAETSVRTSACSAYVVLLQADGIVCFDRGRVGTLKLFLLSLQWIAASHFAVTLDHESLVRLYNSRLSCTAMQVD